MDDHKTRIIEQVWANHAGEWTNLAGLQTRKVVQIWSKTLQRWVTVDVLKEPSPYEAPPLPTASTS